jgi:uncharacterized membrane protein YesL
MRAFLVTWRSLVSFYNELFLLIGANLLWWVMGGFFVAAAVILGWPMLVIGGPWWLAPLIAIPAGPATAALANVLHRAARDLHVDRSFFFDGFREYWRRALALSALLAIGNMLLILNILFYVSRTESLVQAFSLFFIVLLVYWASVQVYIFPILVGMKEPGVLAALKMALMMAFANPLFSVLILVIAALLTGLSVVLAILVLIAWPGIVVMLGAHSLKLVVEMAGGGKEESPGADAN